MLYFVCSDDWLKLVVFGFRHFRNLMYFFADCCRTKFAVNFDCNFSISLEYSIGRIACFLCAYFTALESTFDFVNSWNSLWNQRLGIQPVKLENP